MPGSSRCDTHGTVYRTENGEVFYDPDPGRTGEDRFSYTISDGNGATATAFVTVRVTIEALRAATLLTASLGINAMPLVAPVIEAIPLSLGLLAIEGVSLLAASFWQTVLALQVPLVFLLLSFGLVLFTGGAGNVLTMIGTRRRYYSVVMLRREDRLAVYAEPRQDSEVIHQVLPTDRSVYSGGKAKAAGGATWVPIEVAGVSGWVSSENVAEEMDYQTFLADKRPARLVADFAGALRTGGNLTKLVSPRGLAIALANDVTLVEADEIESLRGGGTRSKTPIEDRMSREAIARFLAAYDATQEISPRTAHSSSALVPSECQNFLYLALEPDATGSPWLVYLEYRGRNVYISGLGIDV